MRMSELKGGEIGLVKKSGIAVQRHGDTFIVLGDDLIGNSTKSNSYDLRAAKLNSVTRVNLSPVEISIRLEAK